MSLLIRWHACARELCAYGQNYLDVPPCTCSLKTFATIPVHDMNLQIAALVQWRAHELWSSYWGDLWLHHTTND